MADEARKVIPQLLNGVMLECPQKRKCFEAKAVAAQLMNNPGDIPESTLQAGLGSRSTRVFVSVTAAIDRYHVVQKMIPNMGCRSQRCIDKG